MLYQGRLCTKSFHHIDPQCLISQIGSTIHRMVGLNHTRLDIQSFIMEYVNVKIIKEFTDSIESRMPPMASILI